MSHEADLRHSIWRAKKVGTAVRRFPANTKTKLILN